MKTLPSYLSRVLRCFYTELLPYSPLAKACLRALDEGNYDWLARVTVSPSSYTDARSYLADASAVSMLRKYKSLPISINKKEAALATWQEGEKECLKANLRLDRHVASVTQRTPSGESLYSESDSDQRISNFFIVVRSIVESWIGFKPKALVAGRFGPGATYTARGSLTTIPEKMANRPTLTHGAIWYLPQWLGTQWGSTVATRHGQVDFVPGNRFGTAPKDSTKDRPIGVEPDINVFYQLALGSELRSEWKRTTGWDLNLAGTINGRVARESSTSKEFATLDLTNASGTLCRALVKLCTPPKWFDQLDGLRSPKTLIRKHWRLLEQFSSMGNGFTFELESIIFAALACAVSKKHGLAGEMGVDVFVNGDDIIVKNEIVTDLISVLRFCGFTLNDAKSFWGDHPFRESCGQDFYNGKPVRPFFLKKDPDDLQNAIVLANGVRALSERFASNGLPPLRRTWFAILDGIHRDVRNCRGPKDLGDIVIHDDPEWWTTSYLDKRHRRRTLRGDASVILKECSSDGIRYIRAFMPTDWEVVGFKGFHPDIVLACATYGTGNRNEGVIPRDGVLSYGFAWVPYS